MSFRNHKTLAGAVSALLIASFFMFVIPEPSSAFYADAGTVIIESEMGDKMPIEEIVVIYGTISAEKDYQESKGHKVLIEDRSTQRADPREQRFIKDLRGIIGEDRFTSNEIDVNVSEDMTEGYKNKTETAPFMHISIPDKHNNAPMNDSKGDDRTVDTSGSPTNMPVDRDFMKKAMKLAEKNDVKIMDSSGYLSLFFCKMLISISYTELQSVYKQYKDADEQTDDCIEIVSDDDDEGPSVPDIFYDLESPSPIIISTVPGVYNTGAVTSGF